MQCITVTGNNTFIIYIGPIITEVISIYIEPYLEISLK